LKEWCGWPDSNRQRGKPQRILSPPRMPISPQPHRTATRLEKHIMGLRSNRNQIAALVAPSHVYTLNATNEFGHTIPTLTITVK
jgi:hypothetical protein